MFTCLSLYGIYSCRAKFMKPLIVDIITSSVSLSFDLLVIIDLL